jgi:hypothetical protein
VLAWFPGSWEPWAVVGWVVAPCGILFAVSTCGLDLKWVVPGGIYTPWTHFPQYSSSDSSAARRAGPLAACGMLGVPLGRSLRPVATCGSDLRHLVAVWEAGWVPGQLPNLKAGGYTPDGWA